MRKPRMEVANMDFVDSLVAAATKKPQPVRVVAQNVQDEAKQSAIAYWTLGWAWNEIEGVLEDSQYPQEVVEYAVIEAKKHAKEIGEMGPFSTLQPGQHVKFKNNTYATLMDKGNDNLVVLFPGETETVLVAKQFVDNNPTAILTQAHELRKQAKKLVAQPLELIDPELPLERVLEAPISQRALPGEAEQPRSSEVSSILEVLPQELQKNIEDMDAAASLYKVADEASKDAYKAYQEQKDIAKYYKEQYKDAAKPIFDWVLSNYKLGNKIGWKLVFKLREKYVFLRNKIMEGKLTAREDVALQLMKKWEYVEKNHPRIAKAAVEYADKEAEYAAKSKDVLEDTITMWPIPKEKQSKKAQEDLWGTPTTDKQWGGATEYEEFVPYWEYFENFSEEWEAELDPVVEEMSSVLDSMIADLEGQALAAAVSSLFRK